MNNLYLILFIAIVSQIPIQVHYIKNCSHNEQLSSGQKKLWIIIIIVFNILGAAAYLFVTRNKTIDYTNREWQDSIDSNIRHCIFLCLLLFYDIMAVGCVIQNKGNVLIVTLLGLSLILFIIGHYLNIKKSLILYKIMPILQVLLVTAANYMSITDNYKFIQIIVVAVIINDYPISYIKVYAAIPLTLFIVTSTSKMIVRPSDISSYSIPSYLFRNTVVYLVFFSMFYIVKKQLLLNYKLQYLMHELKEKTRILEEMSVLKERNRIAREIHDTLGHTLTGAIIQLEAAKKLIHIDTNKTVKAIEQTQSITRAGFADVKRAIQALRPISIEENNLIDALNLLFERTNNDFGCTIKPTVDLPKELSDELKINVYRIIQELITNSIRHGKATEINLTIEHQDNVLRINLIDNGIGCNTIKYGYGLTGIRERANLFQGQTYFNSSVNKGFNSVVFLSIKNHL